MSDKATPGVWIVGEYEDRVSAVYQDELQARRHAMRERLEVCFWEFADKEDQ
ncbi:MAG: hypothetical protein L0G87_01320 [Renibacterium salmoninarum]|nr:hypothetical protein [Renibacterium salmoninarum]